jgi:hypothetical protein
MREFKEYPDGSDILLSLLKKFPALKKEQIVIFFIQSDKTFNRERVIKLIEFLIEDGLLSSKGDIIKLSSTKEINENIINAFWVLLHYVNSKVEFDLGSYPSEIIFKSDDVLNEVIVMDDDSSMKMDYLSKRKHRKNKCKYNFLFTSGTIDDFDDELFPDVLLTLITMTAGKEAPKLVYHEVENE